MQGSLGCQVPSTFHGLDFSDFCWSVCRCGNSNGVFRERFSSLPTILTPRSLSERLEQTEFVVNCCTKRFCSFNLFHPSTVRCIKPLARSSNSRCSLRPNGTPHSRPPMAPSFQNQLGKTTLLIKATLPLYSRGQDYHCQKEGTRNSNEKRARKTTAIPKAR